MPGAGAATRGPRAGGGLNGLRAELRRPGLWPGGTAPVAERETHASIVLLTGDRAWKVRKAVCFPFLDHRTLAARRRAATEEVELNRELAPGTYLAVRPLVRDGDGLRVGEPGTEPPGTVEHVVEMRRFDERDTLAARVEDGRADGALLARLGERLAAFHAAAPRVDPEGGGAAAALARLHRNMEDLVRMRPAGGAAWREAAAVSRSLEAAVLRAPEVHDDRARAGRWRDGHGDLRADHVVADDRGLRIVDRLEFDRGLRCDDVAADLAFLLMDLQARGAPDAAGAVLAAYRAAGGDAGDDRLLAFWSGYRALVSAKVGWTQAAGGDASGEERAARRLAVAHRCAWRARGPRVLAVCGPPASGKSTLAAAAAERWGLALHASDPLRKERAGLAPHARAPQDAYAPAASEALYEELGRHAAAAAAGGAGAVVDATMGRRALRDAFARGLGAGVPVTFVECRVPAAVAQRRAAARLADPGRVSDAGPDVAAALAAAWEPLDEVAPAAHLAVRGDREPRAVLDDLGALLDAAG